MAENRQANPLTKMMSVTLIPKCRLKNRMQNEQIMSIYNLGSYEMFSLNRPWFNASRQFGFFVRLFGRKK